MRSPGLRVDIGTLFTNSNGRSAASLNRCHKFDTGVMVAVVVPVDERFHPLASLLTTVSGKATSVPEV